MALPSSEKNSAIEGTLANEISIIENSVCIEKNGFNKITFLNQDRYMIEDASESHVFVKNGIAIVQINYVVVENAVPLGETTVLCSGLPIPLFTNEWHAFSPSFTREGEQLHILVDGSGNLVAYGGVNRIGYRISFPYFIKNY